LPECWASFQVRFRRPEGRAALERATTGRRTAVPDKNCDTLAQGVPGARAQRWQAFLTTRPGDEAALNRPRVQQRTAEAARGAGVLVVDETGVPKHGTASVGGERRYAGPLGQVGNGPGAVTCGDPERQATWPVAVRLALPKTGAQEPERRQQARVPPEVAFQTTPALALALLEQARAWGGPHGGVGAEAHSGAKPTVLAGWEARRGPSVVAARTDVAGRLRKAATRRWWRADARPETGPRGPWRTRRWRQGTNGGRRQQCVAVRGWRVRRDGQRPAGWLVGERAPRGPPEAWESCGRHRPSAPPLEERAGLAQRRQAIEQGPEAAKGELGWDHDQGRRWPGFQRPAVTVMRAGSRVVWRARRQRRRAKRQGRRGGPLSPAADVPAPDAAGHAS
jgi:DDE superfamily endonuclease